LAGPRSIINNTQMASLVTPVQPGFHILTSPFPLFAIASGFASADAYTFLPGTTSPVILRDTDQHTIEVSVDSAMACHEFGATYTVSPPFTGTMGVMSMT